MVICWVNIFVVVHLEILLVLMFCGLKSNVQTTACWVFFFSLFTQEEAYTKHNTLVTEDVWLQQYFSTKLHFWLLIKFEYDIGGKITIVINVDWHHMLTVHSEDFLSVKHVTSWQNIVMRSKTWLKHFVCPATHSKHDFLKNTLHVWKQIP